MYHCWQVQQSNMGQHWIKSHREAWWGIIYHFNRESSGGQLSVTAVCASLEPTFTQYFGRVPYNAQARNDVIEQLEEIVFKLVQAFSTRNRRRLKYYSRIHSNQIISP